MRIFVLALLLGFAVPAAPPQEIVLRPDLPAGEEWYAPGENQHVNSPSERWVRKVKRPVMEIYPAANPNGAAIVVAPGGGFSILAIEHEGRDVARWLNQLGVTAFVLRYRCGLESGDTPAMNRQLSQKAAIEDGLLAVKTVRERAAEWKIDPKRIGVMGFSAGGYLAIGVATQYTPESRPDFAIPIYAVAPEGFQPPAGAPPLFTVVAFDDNVRMTSTFTSLIEKWKQAKVPIEAHLFPDGGHGFGMNRKGKASDGWIALLAEWMRRQNLLRRPI